MNLTPQQEVQFLVQLQRLLTEGQFVATYKYGLLMALADLSVEKGRDDASVLAIHTREIADKMIRYYWRQCAPYPGSKVEVFRQNTHKEAGIIRMVRQAKAQARGSLPRFIQQKGEWSRLVKKVDSVVRLMPLWKLQTVGNERLNFLYENHDKGNIIELKPGVAGCFRKFYGLVSELVRGCWLRYIRQFNQDILGNAADLQEFLFGSERTDLGVVAPILNEFQAGRCFYCERPLRPGSAQVDHFIPWSRYPVDLGHNFVLAHDRCNASKSDLLAAEDHLARWVESRSQVDLTAEFQRHELIHDWNVSLRVSVWAYQQNDAAQGMTWLEGNKLLRLSPGWRQIFEERSEQE